MPRPLKYSTKDRQRLLASYRNQRDSGDITKDRFESLIARLNRQEEKWRTAQKEKEKRDKLAKKAGLIKQRQVRFLRNIQFRQTGQVERYGRIKAVSFTFEPRILLSGVEFNGGKVETSELLQEASSRILDAIDRSYDNGKLLITVETDHVKNGETTTVNTALGKSFSPPFNTGEIESEVMRRLNLLTERGFGSGVKVYMTSVTFKYIDNPASGGCDSNTHKKRYNDLKILSPKSTKNNCLFACIHHFLGERLFADNTRKALGLPLNTPVHTSQIGAIAKYYGIKVNLFNLQAEKIAEYGSGKECNLMLFVNNNGCGHYVLIEGQTHICDECGKYWVKKHTCSFRRKMWLNRMSGKRCVIPSKIEREEKFNTDNLLYFDLETFKPEGTDQITPYAASWYCDGEYYQSYGHDSWNDFVEFLFKQKNKIVCAYNGAGFDFHFLMSELLLRGEQVDNVILSNSRLMSFKFGEGMRCWDLCLFTLSSLKDACKSFGVSAENTKTEFDHFKIRSWDDVYKYRDEVEPYVKRDVLGMKEVCEKFSDMLYETFKVHMTEFVTLSAMSYGLWTNTVSELIELPDAEKYDFIRSSLYGGRTYPLVREFTSTHYKDIVNAKDTTELKQIYSSMTDWIFNADATSLYPTAMVKYQYPLGNSEWVSGDLVDSKNLKIGIYDVEIECNKSLIVPILPQKTQEGGINWNLLKRRGVYTSADLENAVRFGYTITKVHKGLVWDKSGDIFSDYILRCYKIKEENDDNPVLRQIGKILMNALYGKMLERARFEETKMCNNIEDVWKFQTCFTMTDVQFVKDKVVAIGLPLDEEINNTRIRKPSQIGTFILAYSRRHMLDAMSAICPKLDSHFFTYTDTDSLHIPASALAGLEEKGWLSKGLGQLSDDAKGGKIFREINLAPKLYMYLCLMPDGKIKTCMKSKGIPQQYLSPELFENADDLDDEDKVIVMENRLKKVGLGRNLQCDWRKYDAFSILSVDMERTFYKNQWTGMVFSKGKWYPKK